MTTASHRNVDLVVAALTAGGAEPYRIARLQVLPDAVTTAAAAAAALHVEVGQIANSLVFEMSGGVPLQRALHRRGCRADPPPREEGPFRGPGPDHSR